MDQYYLNCYYMGMEILDLNSFIALVLLKKVSKFRDSYSLTRVLEWKFGIIGVCELTKKLERAQLVNSTLEKGIHKYEVTNLGLKYIEANMSEGKNLLLQKYKSEQEFIEPLFT